MRSWNLCPASFIIQTIAERFQGDGSNNKKSAGIARLVPLRVLPELQSHRGTASHGGTSRVES